MTEKKPRKGAFFGCDESGMLCLVDCVCQRQQCGFVSRLYRRTDGDGLFQDGEVLHGVQERVHFLCGTGRPRAVFHQSDGAFLERFVLQVEQEFFHGQPPS